MRRFSFQCSVKQPFLLWTSNRKRHSKPECRNRLLLFFSGNPDSLAASYLAVISHRVGVGADGGGRGADVRPGRSRRSFGRGAQGIARCDDQPDVPGPQARPCRRHRDAASGEARQERGGGSFQLPDGPDLPRHRHGAGSRPARHGTAAGGSDPRLAARHLFGARPRRHAPAGGGAPLVPRAHERPPRTTRTTDPDAASVRSAVTRVAPRSWAWTTSRRSKGSR